MTATVTAPVPPPGPPQPPARTGWQTFVHGIRLTPMLVSGLGTTLTLAVVATAGRIVVPVAVQQTIDAGLSGGTPDLGLVRLTVIACALALVVTTGAAYWMNLRLYRTTEGALADLRTQAFRHIHAMSTLDQARHRRGALVSRVTSDVDQVSMFVQQGGIFLITNLGQLLIATVIMAIYSWQLTLVVYVCFVPFAVMLRRVQRRLTAAYEVVRHRIGVVLGAVGESVVGAPVIRSYGVAGRTADRVDGAIDAHRRSAIHAQAIAAVAFGAADVVAAVATSAVVVLGVVLGLDGDITSGELVAFLFLVAIFVAPIQQGAELLNQAQNAVAGWRRVIEVLDTPLSVVDPGADGVDLPRRPLAVDVDRVGFAYPGGEPVLHEVDLHVRPGGRVAVVGETGSGKSTLAKLVTRLVDPVEGTVRVGGVDLRTVDGRSLRSVVAMVPQDGFLFDGTIADNVRHGRGDLSDDQVTDAFADLGLRDWLAGLDEGVTTRVGERGEQLSAGERQLVALVRAAVAEPSLIVLDEATSAVDPATETRIARAMERLSAGRTTIAIAHRLSTAIAAETIVVMDAGRIVQQGPHRRLVTEPGVYAGLHAAWVAQHD